MPPAMICIPPSLLFDAPLLAAPEWKAWGEQGRSRIAEAEELCNRPRRPSRDAWQLRQAAPADVQGPCSPADGAPFARRRMWAGVARPLETAWGQ
eukprot:7883395-Pyramimonas_sp.AAC.1